MLCFCGCSLAAGARCPHLLLLFSSAVRRRVLVLSGQNTNAISRSTTTTIKDHFAKGSIVCVA